MSRVRITAAEWVEHHRQGDAKIVDGRRHVAALEPTTGETELVEVDIEDEPDVRCAVIDGRLDAEDMARALTGFRGVTCTPSSSMRYVRASSDGDACAYVFDEDSGMVYILD
jgi:hypothetical protein